MSNCFHALFLVHLFEAQNSVLAKPLLMLSRRIRAPWLLTVVCARTTTALLLVTLPSPSCLRPAVLVSHFPFSVDTAALGQQLLLDFILLLSYHFSMVSKSRWIPPPSSPVSLLRVVKNAQRISLFCCPGSSLK